MKYTFQSKLDAKRGTLNLTGDIENTTTDPNIDAN